MNTQNFRIALSVYDAKTQIRIGRRTMVVEATARYRAAQKAKRILKDEVLALWKANTCEAYGLTAEQLDKLIQGGLITAPEIYDFRCCFAEAVNDIAGLLD